MRALAILSILVLGWLGAPAPSCAQSSPRHHLQARDGGDWASWAGHEVAYLTERLGEPDRVVGARWHYDYVTVGSHDGPYRIWEVTFVIRQGRIVSVHAVPGASVGCDIYE